MFTQISLSLDSNNYLLKIKLNDKALNYLLDNKSELISLKENIGVENSSVDEYTGELFGLAFSEVSHEEMLKKLSYLKNFFESKDLDVFDVKLVTLATRLKQLESIDFVNQQLINSLYLK